MNKNKKDENFEDESLKKEQKTSKNDLSDEKKKEADDQIDFKKNFLHVSADFENFKKRMEKEKTEWGYLAQSDILLKFLPFADDLDRAIKAGEKLDIDEKKKESWLHGFKIIEKNLKKVFKDLGVEEIDCSSKFDPKYHEALLQVESKDKKKGEIVDTVHKGYLFKDKVLKHAKVVVAK
ncbi:MAG: nucleotide exchange factor GrpE [bacterium]